MSLIQSFSQIGQSLLQKNQETNPSLEQMRTDLKSEMEAQGLSDVKASDLISQAEKAFGTLTERSSEAMSNLAAMRETGGGLPRLSASDPRFGNLLQDFVNQVEATDRASSASVRGLLLGESDNIHQTMIKMNEASTAFTLMVEVRNKLVEAYQEVMRMQV